MRLPSRIDRISREIGLMVLGMKVRARAAGCGDDLARLVDVAMSTSFLGTGIRPIQQPTELHHFLLRVRELAPRRILEIGTANGGSLFLLCRVASPDALIVTVDLPGGPFGGGYGPQRQRLYRSFALKDQRIVLVRGDSHAPGTRRAVADRFAPEQVDLLILDGDRSYEGVMADYLDYGPLVRKGGVIAIHDVSRDHPQLDESVADLWEEISQGADAETIIAPAPGPSYGFGLIRKR